MAEFRQLSGKRRVYNLLRREKTISRASLAQMCELTRPAISAIIDEMDSEGLVTEIGRGSSTGGKPPILLSLKPGARCAIGIDLGDDYLIRGVLCDAAGNIFAKESLEYSNNFASIVQTTLLLAGKLASFLPAKGTLTGAGIAVSGIVDPALNEVVEGSSLDIVRKGLARSLEAELAYSVRLEKRPHAAALAESLFGAGKGHDNLVYLTSGSGVGAGIVIAGEIFRGKSGASGEIGGILLPDGRKLEESTRPSFLTSRYRELTGKEVTFTELAHAFRNKEEKALSLVLENASFMAYAAASAARFFDPEILVLGGTLLEFGEKYFAHFEGCFRQGGSSCLLAPSTFGAYGVAAGGAHIILDDLVK